jgi:hypothetical protein
MKLLVAVTLAILSCGLCAAQAPTTEKAALGVTIVEHSWRGRLVRNPALDIDPLLSLEDQDRSERIRNEVIRQNEYRAALGKEPAPLPSRNASSRLPQRRPPHPYEYLYRVKIVNTGNKKIRQVIWEYVLVDPATGSEVGRHRFTSKVSVSPGKSQRLYGYSTLPPASIVDAEYAGQKSAGQHSERVVIKTIYYDDNSVSERPVDE